MKYGVHIASIATLLLIFTLYLIREHLHDLEEQDRGRAGLEAWIQQNQQYSGFTSGHGISDDEVTPVVKPEEKKFGSLEE
ncbi:hypothetical protein N7494_004290 [Penicillium frequentans]|uniref:Uncharacterized protein n=1 Tax=Penicillium frequentans TaxID=3151616 RepID=A0AAD6GGF8_9EURO|nr:hypothetical protein N7494_004290 [Penicillium glabrum]